MHSREDSLTSGSVLDGDCGFPIVPQWHIQLLEPGSFRFA
jgi:hypothetical protein